MSYLCLDQQAIDLFFWIKHTVQTKNHCPFGDYIAWLSTQDGNSHPLAALRKAGLVEKKEAAGDITLSASALWMPSYKARCFLKQIGLQDSHIDHYLERYIITCQMPSDKAFKRYVAVESKLSGLAVGGELLIPIHWQPNKNLIAQMTAAGIKKTDIDGLIQEFVLYNRHLCRHLRCWSTAFLHFVHKKHPTRRLVTMADKLV
ncbi:MAG: hypothetical protein KTR20_05955 [Cellvibrionaceae bacterium]|nr:hypothetical protein [Cellvibrionaceae bacterium]